MFIHEHLLNRRGLCLIACVLLAPLHLLAADVLYEEVSSPSGLLNNQRIVTSENVVTSSAALFLTAGYCFTEWQLGGIRQEDMLGQAINPFCFTIYEPTAVTAVYVPSDSDTDADTIPDWFEFRCYGDLNESADSDSDADGVTLATEYVRDYHPNIKNEITDRGLVWQRSETIFVQLTDDPLYTEKSQPEALVSEIQQTMASGSNVTTRALYGERSGFSFAYWAVNGVRQADLTGRAVDPVTITVSTNTTAVAVHIASGQDEDGNAIPDWYELNYFGATNLTAESDSDGDGVDLATEYARDYNPSIHNDLTAQGLHWQRSAVLNVIASTNYVVYTEKTDPEGLVSTIEAGVLIGTNIATRSLAGSRGGYHFTHWTINGGRKEDFIGQAIDPIDVAVTGTMVVVANHLPSTQDSDGDGIPDWYEIYYLGNTNQQAQSDADGDGVDFLTEYTHDYHPCAANETTARGLVWQRSAPVYVDLQMFERVPYVMTNQVLHRWFASSPLDFESADLGGNTAPAAGDWDGDGDNDIFVGTAGGALYVYENQGTRYTMDLTERSRVFESLVSSWNSLSNACPSLGDWNGDGTADMAVGGSVGWVRILSSTGQFALSQHPAVDYELAVSGSTSAVPAFAEMTGDDNLDLLVLLDNGTVRVYPNSGSDATPFSSEDYTTNLLGTAVLNGTGLAAADVNYDGHTDVLIAGDDGRIWNFLGGQSGFFTLNSKVWAGAGNGFASRLTLGTVDLDGDNDIDGLCGFAEGGLMYLRDPRIGLPSGLQASGGPNSIQLTWEPNRSYRLKGYYVYRSSAEEGPFAKLNAERWPMNSYLDSDASAGVLWHYYLTAVSEAYYPGNTISREVESRPSETVVADTGSVVLWMPDFVGKAGETAVLQVNVVHGTGVSGNGMDLRIAYDPTLLTPISQVSTNTTVRTTALSEELVVTDNSSVAGGEIQISGSSGTVIGDGHLFDVYFQVASGAQAGSSATNALTAVTLFGAGNTPLNVDHGDKALFTVTPSGYFFGDVNGDGRLNMDDHNYLMWLLRRSTRNPTPEEISAGDMNGNGELDHRDIPLLLRLIHEQ